MYRFAKSNSEINVKNMIKLFPIFSKMSFTSMLLTNNIALENTLFKIFTTLLCKRLRDIINEKLPDSQFGFRSNRMGKLHAILIDYTEVFDIINRSILMKKLETTLGPRHHLLQIIRDLLTNNRVQIHDGTDKSSLIQQTVGVLQCDPLSPLLFILAMADNIETIKPDTVNLLTYADDMALPSVSEDDLQKTFNQLVYWAQETTYP
ncbi:uncharacterized protein LOC124555960 [Schistocerca americana]|uniref:uncharacterized protein LOC124555960 n=1 Tax=Schistocerca americana TaxID=7009 RepID=UPI001F4F25F4|nr:uncharacterized protein LOC124555960 [Schistocerca americana]